MFFSLDELRRHPDRDILTQPLHTLPERLRPCPELWYEMPAETWTQMGEDASAVRLLRLIQRDFYHARDVTLLYQNCAWLLVYVLGHSAVHRERVRTIARARHMATVDAVLTASVVVALISLQPYMGRLEEAPRDHPGVRACRDASQHLEDHRLRKIIGRRWLSDTQRILSTLQRFPLVFLAGPYPEISDWLPALVRDHTIHHTG